MGATGAYIGDPSKSGSIQELPITSQGDLDAWERANKRQGIEYAVVLDENGKPMTAFSGDEHSVGLHPRVLDWEGVTFTHNHPDKYFGGSFSTTDLNTFAKSKWAEMRADTAQGKTYILRATPNSDREGLLKYTNSQAKILAKNFKNSYKSALQNAAKTYTDKDGKKYIKLKTLVKDKSGNVQYREVKVKDKNGNVIKNKDGSDRVRLIPKTKIVKRPPMTPAQADKYAREYSVGLYDRTYKKNLEKFGFEYVVKNSKAGSNRPNRGK